eukprot:TRINITY_DN34815_c0_g1_i1.p1 TRINITY_DN34815_c0_g1~~TRINITY_DN34815_c0_g1_i1.p1  ORF type:complete len:261 (-),score=78.69 TRINITY_DN34815_c0_g1_i1:66-848(-)
MGGQQSQQPAAPGGDGQGPAASGGYGRDGPAISSKPAVVPTNKVQLAVSPLGGVPGASAYHSSVVVNGEEFFFSDGGIGSTNNLMSHKNPQNPQSQPTIIDMGMSQYSGNALKATLEKYFQAGTYDLLRKNCNSFSDCALFYLLHQRIDKKYRQLEQLGAKNMGLVQAASGGQYQPNPKAEGFDVEKVCSEIDPEKVWATPGQAIGGTPAANSAEAMRAARLARLSGGGGGAAAGGGGATSASAAEGATPITGVTGTDGI